MAKVKFPQNSKSSSEILEKLQSLKQNDINWKSGKAFAYIYGTEEEVMQLGADAYRLFLTENGLDPTSFPSLLNLEKEVISMLTDLLNGSDKSCGNLTSGGTESVILAVKTARDYCRANKPEIKFPEIVIPETAHPCFHKAAHYLDVKVKMVQIDPVSFRADLHAYEAAITDQTILLVASAPSYAHGVIDPIPEIAKLALKNKLLFHVDACVGAMYLPFLRMLCHDVPAFDFRVEGVSSISCDLHKFGYVPKGCSSILYKDKNLRQYQLFCNSQWPGYSVVNPAVTSSKSGGPMAAAWAVLNSLGAEGYKRIVQDCQHAATELQSGISAIEGLEILGKPEMSLFAFKSTSKDISVFELIDRMNKKGWYLQLQLASHASPEAVHLTVTHLNTEHTAEFIADLNSVVSELKLQKHPSNEMMMGLDASMIQLLMDNFSPDMLDNLEALLGLDVSDNGIPKDMVTINSMLNNLNPEQRDILLNAFVNRMY